MRTPIFPRLPLALALGVTSLSLGPLSFAQEATPAPPEKAHVLMDQIKRGEMDRQVALKQTEIDRLKEDQSKTLKDTAGLQKTIDSTAALLTDSGDRLEKLTTDSRRLEHELAVSEAQTAAEKLKIEGLRALNAAQAKSLSALTRRSEEAEARARVRLVELELLNAGKAIPKEGTEEAGQPELTKARKALIAAEGKTQAEERAARDAMKDAQLKMSAAEAKAAVAQRLADNDLTVPLPPVAEKGKSKTEKAKAEKKDDGDRRSQSSRAAAAPAPVAAAPAGSTASTDARKPSTKPFVPIFKR